MDNTSPKPISSWLDRYLSGERPGFAVVMLGMLALSAVLGMLGYTRFEPEGLQSVGQAFTVELMVAANLVAWLFNTLATHQLAGFFKLRATFVRALHITSKAWILYLLLQIVTEIITILFLSLGWETLAKLWDGVLGVGSILLWVIVYPAAVKCIYGPEAHSCLISFWAWILSLAVIVLLGLAIQLYAKSVGWTSPMPNTHPALDIQIEPTPTRGIQIKPTPTCYFQPQPTGEKIIRLTIEATPATQASAGQKLVVVFSGNYIFINNARICAEGEIVGYMHSDELPGFNWDRTVNVLLDEQLLASLVCGYTCRIEATLPADVLPGSHQLFVVAGWERIKSWIFPN